MCDFFNTKIVTNGCLVLIAILLTHLHEFTLEFEWLENNFQLKKGIFYTMCQKDGDFCFNQRQSQ